MAAPDHTFDIKASLLEIEPRVWRRLLVPGRITLPKLHLALQVAFGWTDSHLHHFISDGQAYGMVDPDWGDEDTIDERRKKLDQFLHQPSDRLIYLYDFGDSWEHEVEVMGSLDYNASQPLPMCIDGEMACPPEDVGGIPGYFRFLEAIHDPAHPEHEELLTWAGGPFDPTAFDLHGTNVLLGRRFPRGV